MEIALGSTNKDKTEILRQVLKNYLSSFQIVQTGVSSGIADQPLDEKTTIQSAKNRAQKAFKRTPGADFAVRLEAGLDEIGNEGYFLVCVAAIYDKKGHFHLGISSKLQLPKEVSDAIKTSQLFGVLIRKYSQKYKRDKKVQQCLRN